MPFFKIWSVRSTLMKVSFVLTALSVMLHSFTLVSRHWSVKGDLELGLFDYITQRVKASEAVMPVVYPVFGVLTLIILLGDLLINMIFLHQNLLLVMPAIITFSFICGSMEVMLIVIWLLPHTAQKYQMSYAFWCACAAAALDLSIGMMCVAEFIRRKQEESPRWRDAPQPQDGEDAEML